MCLLLAGWRCVLAGQFLLCTLNDLLSQTAVLVQPWPPPSSGCLGPVADPVVAAEHLQLADVPLPLASPSSGTAGAAGVTASGVRSDTGDDVEVALSSALVTALHTLGLASAVGVLRVLRYAPPSSSSAQQPATSSSSSTKVGAAPTSSSRSSGAWIPLRVLLGVPLHPLPLAKQVCGRLVAAEVLTVQGRQRQETGQLQLQHHLATMVACYGPLQNAALSARVAGPQQHQEEGGDAGNALMSQAEVQLMGTLPATDLLFDGQQLEQAAPAAGRSSCSWSGGPACVQQEGLGQLVGCMAGLTLCSAVH